MKKEVAILTKSSKHRGYCVAGIDLNTGEWVRFVSGDAQTHGALTALDMVYRGGGICRPLDIVSADVVRPAPSAYQPENYLIEPHKYLEKTGQCTLSDVLGVHPAEVRPYLYSNLNPFVDGEEIDAIGYSLTLVKVSSLTISHTTNMYNKQKTKASFIYNGRWYHNISVTDPYYYSATQCVTFANAYLVISLPDVPVCEDRYYKFIAKIYPDIP